MPVINNHNSIKKKRKALGCYPSATFKQHSVNQNVYFLCEFFEGKYFQSYLQLRKYSG